MKLFGAKIELDFGSGLEIVPQSRLGEVVAFRETIDGYGAAEWVFTLLDIDSPMDSSFLRNMRQARFTLFWGKPGAITSSLLVDGFTREATWDYLTRSAQITCQDSSVKVATKRLQLSLAQNLAGTSRTSILATVLGSYGVTSVVDCPGSVRKAVTESGNNTVLQWVSLFVAPAARRAYWRNGTLYVVPSGIGTPVATLKAHDIRDMQAVPAPTNSTNEIYFTSLLIDDSGFPDGPTVTTVDQEGIYTPKGAVHRQDADGSVHDVTVTPAPSSPIARTVTTQTGAGGFLMETLIEESKWMASYAPRAKQYAATYSEDLPNLTHSGIVCYDFGDGDHWHSQDQESFQIWRRTLVEEIYAFGIHTGRRTTITINWSHFYLPFGRVVNNTTYDGLVQRPARGPLGGFLWFWYGDLEPGHPIAGNSFLDRPTYLWEMDQSSDRIGLAIETFTSSGPGFAVPALVIDDTFIRDGVGDIAAIRRRLTFERGTAGFAGAGGDTRRWRVGPPTFTTFGQFPEIVGNMGAPRHDVTGPAGEIEGEFVISYLPMTEATRTGHVTSVSGTATSDVANRPVGFEAEMALPAPGGSFIVDVAVPVEDRTGPPSNPASITFPAPSSVAANGTYQSPARNDYCETTAEQENVSRDLLRASLSEQITITLDPRGDIRAGDSIALGMLSGQAVLIRQNEIELHLGAAFSATQTLTPIWWPAELD